VKEWARQCALLGESMRPRMPASLSLPMDTSSCILFVSFLTSVECGLIFSSQRTASSQVPPNLQRGIITSLRQVVPVLCPCLFNQLTRQRTRCFIILNKNVLYYSGIDCSVLYSLMFPSVKVHAHTSLFNINDDCIAQNA
jgi:hypothetical protein